MAESVIGDIPVVEARGAPIPLVGLGTWDLRGRTCSRVVEQALRLGYRHIDTAEIYENEREVGEGVRASGVKRSDVFVTTKIWPTHFAPRELERAARDCLARLPWVKSISCCCIGPIRRFRSRRHSARWPRSSATVSRTTSACRISPSR